MKLLHLAVHFELADAVTEILDRHQIGNYVRYPMIEGQDCEGKHFGTQVFPGNITVLEAQIPEELVDSLFEDLLSFQHEKKTHAHLEALLLPIERTLRDHPSPHPG